MSKQKKLALRRKRRAIRVKNSIKGKNNSPRIAVFRSLKHMYAQVIDDVQQKTLVSFSSEKLQDTTGDKTVIARKVGVELGKMAFDQGITNVFFDRGNFMYHGRVKALADGLRESGLQF